MCQFKQSRKLVVSNAEGVHARAATLIAKLLRKFQAKVELVKGAERVEAGDVLQVLSLGAACGEELLAEAWGPDAPAALEALGRLFDHQFEDEVARQFGL
ncbi:MAG TPA: HPr family phosphocarrier protein, partial [Planctomycetaceae bacterium]|nr:HPr family phosphocarrier protein [Planctomycetaceae bacterium]